MHELLRGLITRRHLLLSSATAVAVAGSVGCASSSSDEAGRVEHSKLAIVHTNDTHGHDLLDDESLGLAAVAQLKADYEALGYEVLLLDGGDAVQGDNLVNRSEGDTAIAFMNQVGYDAMVLGNHEFDYGQDKVSDYRANADFAVLSANIIVDATGELLANPHAILELGDGTKVGVFGLTTPETYTKASPLAVRGLTFLQGEELYACAQEQVDALRSEGCALVVCLAHLGEAEGAAPNRACDVVAHVAGIDLVIDGHDHQEEGQLLTDASGAQTLVVETGCYTHAVGVVTWDGETLSHELVAFGAYEGQDPAVAAYVGETHDEVYAELADVLATTAFFLDGERSPGVRTHETNLGDLVADALLWEAQMMADDRPDCAIANGGGIRASIAAGDITLGDVLNVLPFLNYVCTVQVTGAQLLEALEASCSATPEELGAFPQVSGLVFTIDSSVAYAAGDPYPGSTYVAPAQPGSRVTISDVGGRGFDLAETYVIAAPDFMCAGGDTYYVFAEAAQASMKGTNYLIGDCLRYYLAEELHGEVPESYADAAGAGRIDIVRA